MTATLALPPVYAAAVVNGLVGVAVLDAVPCPYERCNNGVLDAGRPVIGHHDCRGSGTVAPSVEPGQRINLAAVGDDPCPRECGKGVGPTGPQIEVDGRMWTVAYAAADDQFQIQNPDGRWYDVHTRKVVGSAVAASTALPIVDEEDMSVLVPDRWIEVGKSGLRMLYDWDEPCLDTDLSAALPWLPSDLVGRWAVLVEDAATTEQRCPTCWGKGWVDCGDPEHSSQCRVGCDGCVTNGTCPPVPLPDGFDPAPYTLTELEMTP